MCFKFVLLFESLWLKNEFTSRSSFLGLATVYLGKDSLRKFWTAVKSYFKLFLGVSFPDARFTADWVRKGYGFLSSTLAGCVKFTEL